jgi:hypothetical protein
MILVIFDTSLGRSGGYGMQCQHELVAERFVHWVGPTLDLYPELYPPRVSRYIVLRLVFRYNEWDLWGSTHDMESGDGS